MMIAQRPHTHKSSMGVWSRAALAAQRAPRAAPAPPPEIARKHRAARAAPGRTLGELTARPLAHFAPTTSCVSPTTRCRIGFEGQWRWYEFRESAKIPPTHFTWRRGREGTTPRIITRESSSRQPGRLFSRRRQPAPCQRGSRAVRGGHVPTPRDG